MKNIVINLMTMMIYKYFNNLHFLSNLRLDSNYTIWYDYSKKIKIDGKWNEI